MTTVWVVGSVNEDIVIHATRAPLPGETVLGTSLTYGPGGKGANQAVAAARAGTATRLVAAIGADAAGKRQTAALDAAGVATDRIIESQEPTGTAIITVDTAGENSIVVIPGANSSLGATDVERALEGLQAADVVLAQAEVPADAIRAAARAARAAGAAFMLNLAPVISLDLESLAIDVLIVNEHEASLLEPACDTLTERVQALAAHSRVAVVTLGARGALVATGGRLEELPAMVPPQVVDTTGAGDAFCGAMAARYAQDRNEVEAVRWGLAAGSLAVRAAGAQGADTSRTAILAALAQATAV